MSEQTDALPDCFGPSCDPKPGYQLGKARLETKEKYFGETKAVEEKRYTGSGADVNKAAQAAQACQGEPIYKKLMQRPTVGRIVNFVQNGVTYAAMIVKVWSNTCVNLLVFPNGSDVITPGAVDYQGIAHSVCLKEPVNTEWSWHWPERS